MPNLNFSLKSWRRIGGHGTRGSWDDPTLRAPRTAIVIDSNLYCGIYGEKQGSAQVWKFDGAKWEIIYSAGNHGSAFNRINSMVVWNGQLVAGVGVWGRPGSGAILVFDLDGKRIRHQILPIRFGATEAVDSLAVWQNHIVAGLAAGTNHFSATTAFSDGGPWKTLDLPVKHAGVYSLLSHDGSLYAGTWNRYLGKGDGAGVFKLSAEGWRALGGDDHPLAVAAVSPMVMTLTSTPETVYGTYSLGLDRPESHSPIWKLSNDVITLVPANDKSGVIQGSTNFNAAIWFENNFIFSSGASPDHQGGNRLRVWKLNNDGTCTGIGGEQFGGWRDATIGAANPIHRVDYAWIYKLMSFRGSLVAFIAFGIGDGQGEVWVLE